MQNVTSVQAEELRLFVILTEITTLICCRHFRGQNAQMLRIQELCQCVATASLRCCEKFPSVSHEAASRKATGLSNLSELFALLLLLLLLRFDCSYSALRGEVLATCDAA